MRTQVVIVGSGPSGLLLGQLQQRAGVDTIIVERETKSHVLGPIRSGVIEQRTVALIEEAGSGLRMRHECFVHGEIDIASGDVRHRIDFKELIDKTVTVFGQTEVTTDVMDVAEAKPRSRRIMLACPIDGTPPARQHERDFSRRVTKCRMRSFRSAAPPRFAG